MARPSHSRASLKTSDAQARRRAMNQRRHELSERIRKQKKSTWLTQRRQTSSASTSSVSDAVASFLIDHQLEQLHQATLQPVAYQTSLPREQLIQLLNILLSTNVVQQEPELALQVLYQMAPHAAVGDVDTASSYYGASWEERVLDHPTTSQLIAQHLYPHGCWAIYHLLQSRRGNQNTSNFVSCLQTHNVLSSLGQSLVSSQDPLPPLLAMTVLVQQSTWSSLLVTPAVLETLQTRCLVQYPSETAWFFCYMTQHEEVLDSIWKNDELCRTLIRLLTTSATASGNSPQEGGGSSSSIVIPCLRTLGHLCCSSDSVHHLLQQHSATQWLAWLQQQPSVLCMWPEAAWLAGCLLCDARIPQHASTTIAAPTLIPALLQALMHPDTPNHVQRELVHALWNAISDPPSTSSHDTSTSTVVLVSTDEWLQWMLQQAENLFPVLVKLLQRSDADAQLASLHVCDALLRYTTTCKVLFEELGVVDALERLCEQDLFGDIPADLLDDLFEPQDEEEEDAGFLAPTVVQSNGGAAHFAFGVAEEAGRPFAFGSVAPPPRGRGQSATIPAWMQRQQQQHPS